MSKYKFVLLYPDSCDIKIKDLEFELFEYEGRLYMDSSHYSISVDENMNSESKYRGRVGYFEPIS